MRQSRRSRGPPRNRPEEEAVRKLSLIAAIVAAALVAAALSIGSSHREAPNTANDPTADDTDVYAFKAKDRPGSLTVVANWIPLEDPAGGPNFFNFDPKAHYYVNVDNSGDGRDDMPYQFAFRTIRRNPNSFAAAPPPLRSLDRADRNVRPGEPGPPRTPRPQGK